MEDILTGLYHWIKDDMTRSIETWRCVNGKIKENICLKNATLYCNAVYNKYLYFTSGRACYARFHYVLFWLSWIFYIIFFCKARLWQKQYLCNSKCLIRLILNVNFKNATHLSGTSFVRLYCLQFHDYWHKLIFLKLLLIRWFIIQIINCRFPNKRHKININHFLLLWNCIMYAIHRNVFSNYILVNIINGFEHKYVISKNLS